LTVDQIRAARTALDALDAVLVGLTRPRVDGLTFRLVQEPLPNPNLVSPTEVARVLGVTPRTVQKWIIGGALPAVELPAMPPKPGKPASRPTYRVRRSVVLAILEKGVSKTAEMADAA
jgi:hypothetical protein